jgi:hypothetical protein
MLSINYIQNYLTDEQVKINNLYYNKLNFFEKKKIDNIINNDSIINNLNENKNIIQSTNESKNNTIKLENYCENLYNSFDILFNTNIADYYYNNRLFRNKSSIFTFLNSVFNIGDDFFNIFDEKTRENIIKKFVKKIDNDLFEQNLYNKFNYSKNRKFNKSDIQNVLKHSFQFKNIQKFELIKQYIADYLGINIYILHVNSNVIDFKESEYYLSEKFKNNNDYIKFLPSFLIMRENEIYKPILNKNNSIFTYSNNNKIIDKLWELLDINVNVNVNIDVNINLDKNNILDLKTEIINLNNQTSINKIKNIFEVSQNEINNVKLKFNIDNLKNFKINELKDICEENNISLKKNSDKTSKMINKLKDELIEELLLVKL